MRSVHAGAVQTQFFHFGVFAKKNRSEVFPRTGYFIPGRDGMGAWQISGVIHAAARALF